MPRRTAAFALVSAALVCCLVGGVEITLVNESLEMVFDTELQGGLRELRNIPCDVPFITPPDSPSADRSPWLLVLKDSVGSLRQLTARDATGLTHKLAGRTLEMTWTGLPAGVGAEGLRVTMQVLLLPSDGKSRWELSVEGMADGVLWDVQFPRFVGMQGQSYNELALPMYLGRLVRDPIGSGLQVTMDYPQPASMQWVAWWGAPTAPVPPPPAADGVPGDSAWRPDLSAAAGLYLAAEDGDGWHKRIAVSSRTVPGRLSWWLHHLPPLDQWPIASGSHAISYSLPYPVVLSAFRGDYQEAAGLYREWARRRAWCRRGTVGTWSQAAPVAGSAEEALWVPPWFRQVAFWAKFYHEPAKVLPEWAAYRRWLRVPMASHYYRYTIAGFDNDYPEALPADPYLVPGMLAAGEMGVRPLPYTNGVIWDTDTQSWMRENGLAAAIKDEAGHPIPWDIQGEVFAYMCPVEQWRAKLRETTRKLVGEHAMAGVYLDCLAATRAMPCYDPRHQHSLHGGDHRAKNTRRLLEELRRDTRRLAPGAAFFTEEIGEQFLDLMDGFLTLDYSRASLRPGEQVFPLFSVVYHPYALNFGSDAQLDMEPDRFALEMGTLLTWGAVPLLSATVAVPPQEGDANSEMLRELVQAYHSVGTPFLQDGQWERLTLVPESGTRPTGALSLAARPHAVAGAGTGPRQRPWYGPAVLGSAWRQGNAVGIVLVNLTAETQTATLWADAAGLSLPAGSQLTTLWPDASVVATDTRGSSRLTLGPRRVAILALGDAARVWRRQALDECPWDLLTGVEGPLPEAVEEDGFLRACDDGPVVHQFAAGRATITATAVDEMGVLVRRAAHQAETRGPAAEGKGLPRRRLDQPFALLRRLPHRFVGGDARVTVLGGGDDWLLCRVAGACRIDLATTGILCRLASDVQAPVLTTGASVEVPAGQGETIVAFWAVDPSAGKTLAACAGACATAVAEADTVDLALGALATSPSPGAIASLSRALAGMLAGCGKTPGLAGPGSPLVATVQRCNALVSGLTGMEAVLIAEDDWLTPGLPKPVTLVTRGVPTPAVARLLVLADVPAGSADVSPLPVAPGSRVLGAQVLLRREDYVERIVPVAAVLPGAGAAEGMTLSSIVWLESNRPVRIDTPIRALTTMAGREATTDLVVRNLSPTELNLSVTTVVPPGWTITVAPPELRLAPLADRSVRLAMAAPADARSQSVTVGARVLWGAGQERGVAAEVHCSVQEQLAVLKRAAQRPAENSPARLRQRNQVVLWVPAGEAAPVTVRNLRVTRYEDTATVRLLDPAFAPVAQAAVRVDEQGTLTAKSPVGGVFYLSVDVGSGSVELGTGGWPSAEVASAESPLALFCSPVQRWFYVPRNARQFAVYARDGGEDETARIRILAPDGTVACERDGEWAGEPHRVLVPPGMAGKVWMLECQPRQDVSLWLAGDVCPYLSLDPTQVLVPAAELASP